ncbi:hypothetical protein ACQQ2N_01235 [Dokdonella sp. MW10]|uniref:hypothetical protein n=1 Tax=Dokdonella sp. MW10 TaxID=2992926 RepID=UPI003F7E20EB
MSIVLCFVMLAACAKPAVHAPGRTDPADDAGPRSAADAGHDAWTLPGTFSEFTTMDDLRGRFGAGNVVIVASPEEGAPDARSVVLFPDDPVRRAYVRFHDDAELAQLASVEIRDADSRWRGKHGVRVGMTLAEVRAINGKPFYLSGFDSRGRGYARGQWSPALDDDDGRLGALDVDGEDRLYFGVDFRLRAGASARDGSAWPRDEYLSSEDPRWPDLGEAVVVDAILAWSSLDDEWQ